MPSKALLAISMAALLALGNLATSGSTEAQACTSFHEGTEEVLPGVILTWDSAFVCADAPDEGRYRIEVRVSNHLNSSGSVQLRDIVLSHATPRPGGRSPDATGTTQQLPTVVAAGESASFVVKGSYELATTDEGKKANLHFRLHGVGIDDGDPFRVGINVHIRAPGVPVD